MFTRTAAAPSLSSRVHEDRILLYMLRAAERRPLFTGGRSVKVEPAVVCMGCGAVPTKRSSLYRYGWLVREVYTSESVKFRETYCPECRP